VSLLPLFSRDGLNVHVSVVVEPEGADEASGYGAEDILIVRVAGALDTNTSGQLESTLTQHLDRGALRIILELTEMDYVSSVGLRVFLASLKRLRASEGRLVLSGLNEEVREIFEMAGFSSLFEISSSLNEARSCLVQCD
jgi:anti-anti-sigma factor